MRLSEFDFSLSYRKGKFMEIADCLSMNAQRDSKFRDDDETLQTPGATEPHEMMTTQLEHNLF